MTTQTATPPRMDRPVAWTLLGMGVAIGLMVAPTFAHKVKAEPAPVVQPVKAKVHKHRVAKAKPAPVVAQCEATPIEFTLPTPAEVAPVVATPEEPPY